MDCPRCTVPLTTIDTEDGTTVDFCPACGGTFFDEGEFQAFYSVLQLPVPTPGAMAGDLRCPRCDTPMVEWDHHDADPLLIDHCGGCRGLWLDRGEGARLRDLARAAGPEPLLFQEVPQLSSTGEPEPWYMPVLRQQIHDDSLRWKWIAGGTVLTVVAQAALVGLARFWELQDALQEGEGLGRGALTVLAGLMAFPIGGWLVGRGSTGHTVLEPMLAAVPAAVIFGAVFHQQVGPGLTVVLMGVGAMLALVAAGIAERSS